MNMHTTITPSQHPTSTDRWTELLTERDAAKSAYDVHHETISTPLYDELDRLSPRPELHFEIEALDGRVARYTMSPNDLHAWDDYWSPVVKRNAAEVRSAWLAYRATYDELGIQAVDDESERLCDIQCDLENRLLEIPAPDTAALLWKLDYLFGPETLGNKNYCDAWCARWIAVLMHDARRLIGRGTTNA